MNVSPPLPCTCFLNHTMIFIEPDQVELVPKPYLNAMALVLEGADKQGLWVIGLPDCETLMFVILYFSLKDILLHFCME